MRAIPLAIALLVAGCAKSDSPLWSGWPMVQRTEMPIPGLGGEVWISIDDIRNGATATVYVFDEHRRTLAQKIDMRRGDTLQFEHMGERHEVAVLRYVDKIAMDVAYLEFRRLPE